MSAALETLARFPGNALRLSWRLLWRPSHAYATCRTLSRETPRYVYYAACVTIGAFVMILAIQLVWTDFHAGLAALPDESAVQRRTKAFLLSYFQRLVDRNAKPSIQISLLSWVLVSVLLIHVFSGIYARLVRRWSFSFEWSRSALCYYSGLRELLTALGFVAACGVVGAVRSPSVAANAFGLCGWLGVFVMLFAGQLVAFACIDRTVLRGNARRLGLLLMTMTVFCVAQTLVDLFHVAWVWVGWSLFPG